jgi:hypothetical protein
VRPPGKHGAMRFQIDQPTVREIVEIADISAVSRFSISC